jgi:hypothetical protein
MTFFNVIFTCKYTHGVSVVPPDSPCILKKIVCNLGTYALKKDLISGAPEYRSYNSKNSAFVTNCVPQETALRSLIL